MAVPSSDLVEVAQPWLEAKDIPSLHAKASVATWTMQIRDLTRSIYGRHDDNYEDWEMIEGSDLDSEGDESDDSEDFSSADDDSSSGSNDSSIGSDNDWDTDDDGGGPPDPNGQAMFDFMGGPIPDGGPNGDDSSDDDFSASSFYSTSDESSDESSIDESSSSSEDDEDEGGNGHNQPVQPAAELDTANE